MANKFFYLSQQVTASLWALLLSVKYFSSTVNYPTLNALSPKFNIDYADIFADLSASYYSQTSINFNKFSKRNLSKHILLVLVLYTNHFVLKNTIHLIM